MLIALVLFALIGVAGFTLLDSVLRTQDATGTRMSRMAEVQRAMLVVSSDLDQITGGLAGTGPTLSLQKTDLSGGVVSVRYDLAGTTLTRTVAGPAGQRTQTLITDVSAVRWTFHRRRGDWLALWPGPPGSTPAPSTGATAGLEPGGGRPDAGVTAVALDLTLLGLDGRAGATLRRVASIPLMDPPPSVTAP